MAYVTIVCSGDMLLSLLTRSSTKKDRNDIGYIDGQIGRYKGGVQLVSQSELKQAAGKSHKKTRR